MQRSQNCLHFKSPNFNPSLVCHRIWSNKGILYQVYSNYILFVLKYSRICLIKMFILFFISIGLVGWHKASILGMLSNSVGSYLTIFPSNNVNLVPRKSRIIPLAHLASGILRTNVRFARSDSFLTLSELTLWNTSPGRYYLKILFPNSKYKVRKSQRVSRIKSIQKIYKSSKYKKVGQICPPLIQGLRIYVIL